MVAWLAATAVDRWATAQPRALTANCGARIDRLVSSPFFETTHLALASLTAVGGDLVVLSVSEYEQGHTVLNGDGDANGCVTFVDDDVADAVTNIGVAQGAANLLARGHWIVSDVEESRYVLGDLNGDGDELARGPDGQSRAATSAGVVLRVALQLPKRDPRSSRVTLPVR